MAARLAAAFLTLLLVDLSFWSLANFGRFLPPSSGSLAERAYCFAISTCGPIALVINGRIVGAGVGCVVTSGIIAALVGLSLRGRRFLILRVLGYLGVLLWWLVGFGVAAIRIT